MMSTFLSCEFMKGVLIVAWLLDFSDCRNLQEWKCEVVAK